MAGGESSGAGFPSHRGEVGAQAQQAVGGAVRLRKPPPFA